MLRFLILAAYFELTMYLELTGKLDQYINLHYRYLAYLSMGLSLILAIVQLVVWMKRLSPHSHLTKPTAQLTSLGLLVLPLVVGLAFPTVALDATTVSAKGYHFPVAAGNDAAIQAQEGTSTLYLKPDTSTFFTKANYNKEMQRAMKKYQAQPHLEVTNENYMEIMELIYNYPDQFVDKTLTYTGFVYNDPDRDQAQFLFRFGIIHCIADSGVFGLLTTGVPEHFEDNSWVQMTGRINIVYHQALQQALPSLVVTDYQAVKAPENPYVYRVF